MIRDGLAKAAEDVLLFLGVDAAAAASDDIDALEAGLARTADVSGGTDWEQDAVDAADGAAALAAGDDLEFIFC